MKKEMICITCPIGCHLNVEWNEQTDEMIVSGNKCKRGEVYAANELKDPKRMITSLVKITGGIHPVLPVITSGAIPKPLIFDVMNELKEVEVKSPIKMGEVIIENILNTGVDVLASRSM